MLTVEPPALETSHRPIRSHLKLSLVRQAVQSFVSAWANSFFGLLNRQIDEGIKVWEKKTATLTVALIANLLVYSRQDVGFYFFYFHQLCSAEIIHSATAAFFANTTTEASVT